MLVITLYGACLCTSPCVYYSPTTTSVSSIAYLSPCDKYHPSCISCITPQGLHHSPKLLFPQDPSLGTDMLRYLSSYETLLPHLSPSPHDLSTILTPFWLFGPVSLLIAPPSLSIDIMVPTQSHPSSFLDWYILTMIQRMSSYLYSQTTHTSPTPFQHSAQGNNTAWHHNSTRPPAAPSFVLLPSSTPAYKYMPGA